MTLVLLQNPSSPLASELQGMLSWNGIYYQPLNITLPAPLVVLWDSHNFAGEFFAPWRQAIGPRAAVLALLGQAGDVELFRDMPGLSMTLGAPFSPALIKHNLQLAWQAQERQQELHQCVESAKRGLEDMKIMAQAKKWLMENWGMDEADAHYWMQRESRNKRQKMTAVASQVLAGHYPGKK